MNFLKKTVSSFISLCLISSFFVPFGFAKEIEDIDTIESYLATNFIDGENQCVRPEIFHEVEKSKLEIENRLARAREILEQTEEDVLTPEEYDKIHKLELAFEGVESVLAVPTFVVTLKLLADYMHLLNTPEDFETLSVLFTRIAIEGADRVKEAPPKFESRYGYIYLNYMKRNGSYFQDMLGEEKFEKFRKFLKLMVDVDEIVDESVDLSSARTMDQLKALLHDAKAAGKVTSADVDVDDLDGLMDDATEAFERLDSMAGGRLGEKLGLQDGEEAVDQAPFVKRAFEWTGSFIKKVFATLMSPSKLWGTIKTMPRKFWGFAKFMWYQSFGIAIDYGYLIGPKIGEVNKWAIYTGVAAMLAGIPLFFKVNKGEEEIRSGRERVAVIEDKIAELQFAMALYEVLEQESSFNPNYICK